MHHHNIKYHQKDFLDNIKIIKRPSEKTWYFSDGLPYQIYLIGFKVRQYDIPNSQYFIFAEFRTVFLVSAKLHYNARTPTTGRYLLSSYLIIFSTKIPLR